MVRLRSGSQEYPLARNVLNDGQEIISIPPTIPPGLYTLEMKTYVNGVLVKDSTDFYFEVISGNPSSPQVPVPAPNIQSSDETLTSTIWNAVKEYFHVILE